MANNKSERGTMNVREVARKLNLNPVLTYKLVKSGAIPSIKLEGTRRVLISTAVVNRLLADPGALAE